VVISQTNVYYDALTTDTCRTIKYKNKSYCQCFDRFGRITSDGYYKNSKRTSTWRFYHDGFLLSEGKYKNNTRNGKWQEFYLDGTEQFIGKFVDGKRTGTWKVYKSDFDLRIRESNFTKKLIEVRIYENDKLIKQTPQ
jgi:antitoxin component YwqK of YwqJK toxin-antitoxin module